jgi:hypothetical protein
MMGAHTRRRLAWRRARDQGMSGWSVACFAISAIAASVRWRISSPGLYGLTISAASRSSMIGLPPNGSLKASGSTALRMARCKAVAADRTNDVDADKRRRTLAGVPDMHLTTGVIEGSYERKLPPAIMPGPVRSLRLPSTRTTSSTTGCRSSPVTARSKHPPGPSGPRGSVCLIPFLSRAWSGSNPRALLRYRIRRESLRIR